MEHISNIQNLAALLNDVGSPVHPDQLMSKITTSLPAEYNTFRTVWNSVTPAERTMITLTARLQTEENSLKLRTANAPQTNNNGNEALYSHHNGNGGFLRNNKSRNNYQNTCKPNKWCTFCKRSTHNTFECRSRPRDSDDGPTPNKMAKLAQPKQVTFQDVGFISSTCVLANKRQNWYADSGATQHMSDCRPSFTNYQAISLGEWTVDGIGGVRLPVEGKGDVHVKITAQGKEYETIIKDVLYVPKIGVNLLSIATITDRGIDVNFRGTSVQFSRNDQVYLTGKRIGRNLYELDMVTLNQKQNSPNSALMAVPLRIWHDRFSHVNYDTLKKMIDNQSVNGIELKGDTKPPPEICEECTIGKMHRLPFPKSSRQVTKIGELVHSDVCGPMEITTPKGQRYYVTFKDEYSGYRAIYLMKNKSETFNLFKEYLLLMKMETGEKVTTLRSDNGGEYVGNDFEQWLKENGIRHEKSAPYTPQQNGAAERENRTIVEPTRGALNHKKLPKWFWGEAVHHTVYSLNRTLSTKRGKTPFELWYKKKPDVSHLRGLGAIGYILIPDADRRKLDAKGRKCYMGGYSLSQKAYRMVDITTRETIISRDVIFDETDQPECNLSPPTETLNPTSKSDEAPTLNEPQSNAEITITTNDHKHKADQFDSAPTRQSKRGLQPKRHFPMEETSFQPIKRRQTGATWEAKLSQGVTWDDVIAHSFLAYNHSEPRNFKEAMESPDATAWKKAADEEYQTLIDNDTWEVTPLPPGRSAIGCLWTFKNKLGVNGELVRRKARCCSKGYNQRYGIDYEETYSPVARKETILLVMATGTILDLELWQIDVKGAFLYAEIDKEMYMEQPEGYALPGRENEVCRLKKCIYGLKQSSRRWNQKLDSFLIKFGLQPSDADPCLYYRQDSEGIIIFALWVDDGLIAGNNAITIEKILQYLRSEFEMTAKQAQQFIGLEIIRDRITRKTYVSLSNFIERALAKFNLENCNPKAVPADPNTKFTKKMCPETAEEKEAMESTPYREAIGCLTYIATTARPDISNAVTRLAPYCQNPGKLHWNGVKQVFAYLKGTSNLALCFHHQENLKQKIIGYADSDYAGDLDEFRSTSGYVFQIAGGAISWRSRRQSIIAQSTTEAEYVATNAAGREAVWLRKLANGVGSMQVAPCEIMIDNASAYDLAHNPEFHARTKHFGTKYHYTRQIIKDKEIELVKVPTELQVADILTKPLPPSRFRELRTKLGLVPAPKKE